MGEGGTGGRSGLGGGWGRWQKLLMDSNPPPPRSLRARHSSAPAKELVQILLDLLGLWGHYTGTNVPSTQVDHYLFLLPHRILASLKYLFSFWASLKYLFGFQPKCICVYKTSCLDKPFFVLKLSCRFCKFVA